MMTMAREREKRPIDLENMMRQNAHPIRSYAIRIVIILIGDLLGAIAVNNFLTPARILAGGLTGISQLINHFIPALPTGSLYLVLNIPLFILGYRYLGRRFIILTGVGIAGFSVFTDTVRLHIAPPSDPLLLVLYGGVLLGASSGLVIRAGGSTGGTDIVSLVYNRKTGKSVGGVSFGINAVVVLLSTSVFGVAAGMYTLVSMFAAARVTNSLLHYQHRKTALIVTTRPKEVASEILERLGRGSTLLHGVGTYTGQDLGVLMCVVTDLEIGELKLLVKNTDPKVFISILDTSEVVGHFKYVAP
jgi:uncharacterized membrane-anchored protein YitT (DUF2179 family)